MPGAVSAHSAEPRIQYENDVSSSSENTEKAEEEKIILMRLVRIMHQRLMTLLILAPMRKY